MVSTLLALLAGGVDAAVAAGPAPADGGYREQCAACHGESGRGDGPDAALFTVRPRNLRDGLLGRYDTEALVRMVRDGKPLSLALDPAALRARSDEIEELVTYLRRLPTVDWHRAERGEELYVTRCESCHGRYGEPGPVLPPGVRPPRDLSDPAFQRSVEDTELLAIVRHGRRGMPAIARPLSDDDARALAAYVRLLSPGHRLYSRFCAACHGDDGRADELVEPGVAPRVVFDRDYVAQHDPEWLRTKVWHMMEERRPAMPHFRSRLSEAQARAIVEYLRRTDPDL